MEKKHVGASHLDWLAVRPVSIPGTHPCKWGFGAIRVGRLALSGRMLASNASLSGAPI